MKLKAFIEVLFVSALIFPGGRIFGQIINWEYIGDGPAHYSDGARSIVYGTDGNIYIAGAMCWDGFNSDMMIASLAPNGEMRWIQRVSGSGGGFDEARKVICGEDGNIYVVGTCFNNETYEDITVAKFTAEGELRWVYYYNGDLDTTDFGYSIDFGADGNIYVAGASINTPDPMFGGFPDFTVISLDTAGNFRWEYTYSGPDNQTDEAYDILYCSETDRIYVGGYSSDTWFTSSSEFTVVCLDTNGTEIWNWRYQRPAYYDFIKSIIYEDGNLYAAGYSFDPTIPEREFIVLSLTPDGSLRWLSSLNDSTLGYDQANDLAYDSNGSLYVCGLTYRILIAETSFYFTVVKLDTSGELKWIYHYNRPEGDDFGEGLCITCGGNNRVYIGGILGVEPPVPDFGVICLDTAGTEQWVYSYSAQGNQWSGAHGLVFGGDNNIYAAGWVNNTAYHDILVVSLSEEGASIKERTDWQSLRSTEQILEIFPNPFHQKASIKISNPRLLEKTVTERSSLGFHEPRIRVEIRDVSGRLVKTFSTFQYVLNNSALAVVDWDGTDDYGNNVPTGVYFVRLESEDYQQTEKVILLR